MKLEQRRGMLNALQQDTELMRVIETCWSYGSLNREIESCMGDYYEYELKSEEEISQPEALNEYLDDWWNQVYQAIVVISATIDIHDSESLKMMNMDYKCRHWSPRYEVIDYQSYEDTAAALDMTISALERLQNWISEVEEINNL